MWMDALAPDGLGEGGRPSVVRAKDQVTWKDPEPGYVRRILSPPHPKLRVNWLKSRCFPARRSLWRARIARIGTSSLMLEGALSLDIDAVQFHLQKGDCVR